MKKFEKTPAQQPALKLLQSPARHILLYGGSRSGKTFILVYALLVRALKAPGSRHAILRFHGNGAKYAVGFDTLPKVINLAFPGLKAEYNKSDNCFILPTAPKYGWAVWMPTTGPTVFSAESLPRFISTNVPKYPIPGSPPP